MNEHLVIPRGHRVHWFRVICEIVAADLTLQAIADELGVTHKTVRDWRDGAHPRHADGEKLIAMWCEARHLERAQVPVISEFDFTA